MMCPTHNREFKGPNAKGNFWHVINYDKGEYCNKPAPEFEKFAPEPSEPVIRVQVPQETPDWDAITRGKVRNSVAVAFIPIYGGDPCTQDRMEVMETWVNYIMEGIK